MARSLLIQLGFILILTTDFFTPIVDTPRTFGRIIGSTKQGYAIVAVMSTIASARPVIGASSTEPLTSTISAWRPVTSK